MVRVRAERTTAVVSRRLYRFGFTRARRTFNRLLFSQPITRPRLFSPLPTMILVPGHVEPYLHVGFAVMGGYIGYQYPKVEAALYQVARDPVCHSLDLISFRFGKGSQRIFPTVCGCLSA